MFDFDDENEDENEDAVSEDYDPQAVEEMLREMETRDLSEGEQLELENEKRIISVTTPLCENLSSLGLKVVSDPSTGVPFTFLATRSSTAPPWDDEDAGLNLSKMVHDDDFIFMLSFDVRMTDLFFTDRIQSPDEHSAEAEFYDAMPSEAQVALGGLDFSNIDSDDFDPIKFLEDNEGL